MMSHAFEKVVVRAADSHRNGVGGAGYIVALVEVVDPNLVPADGPVTFLITWFPSYDNPESDHKPTGHQEEVAAVRLDLAARGNIFTFPGDGQPGNAWRSADCFQRVLPEIYQVAFE